MHLLKNIKDRFETKTYKSKNINKSELKAMNYLHVSRRKTNKEISGSVRSGSVSKKHEPNNKKKKMSKNT